MFRNVMIVTSIAGLSVANEYVKTQVCRSNVFKQTISDIQAQLRQIDIKLQSNAKDLRKQASYTSQGLVQRKQEQQQLFDMILTPQIQKMLSRRSKNKIQFIRKLKNDHNQNVKTSAYITGVHMLGAMVQTSVFYWSAIIYCGMSQISFINDFYTLKTGNKLVNLPFKAIGELYLKTSSVFLILLAMRTGIRRLGTLVQTKQIVKKQP